MRFLDPLDFLDFSLNPTARDISPIFDEKVIYQIPVEKYDFLPKDGANCDSGANSGQFGKPSYSIFHPTTSFLDAETIQEK